MWSKQMKDGRWWVMGYSSYGPMGPYNTKAEAEETRRGMEQTLKHHLEPGFISTEPIKEKKHENPT